MVTDALQLAAWAGLLVILLAVVSVGVGVAAWLGQLVYVRLITGHRWPDAAALLRSRHRQRIRWLPGGFSHRRRRVARVGEPVRVTETAPARVIDDTVTIIGAGGSPLADEQTVTMPREGS